MTTTRCGEVRRTGKTATHTSRPSASQSGFTLIELMVVIFLIALIAGWALVDYSGATQRQKLQSVVREFVSVYRETRARAIKERRFCELELDLERQRYRVRVYPYTDTTGNYIDSEGNPLDPEWIEERIFNQKWRPIDHNVLLEKVQAPGPGGNEDFAIDYYVQFRNDGTIPPHILHFSVGGQSNDRVEMSLLVEEITGSVIVQPGFTEFYSPQPDEFDAFEGGSSLGR